MHEAWPKAHDRATAGPCDPTTPALLDARPSAQPYVACATRSESLPITSRAGNDRNASPGELDFMYRGMTRGMKAHVSTMLTESGLSIPLRVRHFKGLARPNGGCKTTSTAFRVLFVLTLGKPLDVWQSPAARSHILARRDRRQLSVFDI